MAILFSSCKKEATRWHSDWVVPILTDTLSLSNLYNDSTLSISASQINIDLSRTLLDLGLSDLVKIPDTTISQQYQANFTVSNVSPGFTFVNSVNV